MTVTNIHEAKTHFSKLVERAEAGETVIIARAGKPVAKLVPMEAPVKRRIGFLDGQAKIPDDFDTMMQDEIEAMFYGE